jgi:predicted SnoaL-like aldol condensation-catalyzing enzyme
MSTEENKAVVRRIWEEILNKGDLALVDEIIATNYVGHGPGGQEVKGSEGLKQLFTMYLNAFPDLHFTIEDMVAEGDKVVCHVTGQGKDHYH